MSKFIKKVIERDVARVRKHPIFWMYTAFGSGVYLGIVFSAMIDDTRKPLV